MREKYVQLMLDLSMGELVNKSLFSTHKLSNFRGGEGIGGSQFEHF